MSDEAVAVQLAFLTEKYLQLEQKFEDLSRENLHLRTRIEAVEENKDTKEQLQSESKPINGQLQSESKQINSHHTDDYTDNETITNTVEKENVYTVAENEHEKEKYYESHQDLETMADVVKSNSDLKEATTNKMNDNHKDGIYKEKRLLIDSVNNITTSPPADAKVAFYAALTHGVSLGQHHTVEYDTVFTNVGNAYDSRHGHFTPPVKGVYLMSFTLMNKNGEAMAMEMVRNGVRIAYGYGSTSGFNMGKQVAIVMLENGDMVWIIYARSSTEALQGHEYNTFAGTLLFTMQ